MYCSKGATLLQCYVHYSATCILQCLLLPERTCIKPLQVHSYHLLDRERQLWNIADKKKSVRVCKETLVMYKTIKIIIPKCFIQLLFFKKVLIMQT